MGGASSKVAERAEVLATFSARHVPPNDASWNNLFGGVFSEPVYLEPPEVVAAALGPMCQSMCTSCVCMRVGHLRVQRLGPAVCCL